MAKNGEKKKAQGRWLIASNVSPGPICFRNPDRDADDDEHLSLSGFESKIIDEMWLDIPWFVKEVESGRIVTYRADVMPDNRHTAQATVERLVESGMTRNAAMTIWQMCAADPLPPELDQYIDLAPTADNKQQFGATYINVRWDLVDQHLPFLRAFLEEEQAWRNRPDIVARVQSRIEEIESLR